MPIYEYRCNDCQKTFTVVHSMADHSKTAVQCPDCKSKNTAQVFTSFFAKTDSKS